MSVKEEVAAIHKRIRSDLSHPYVGRYLPKPVIDDDKLLVYYLLFSSNTDPGCAGMLTESVMFAEIGLATHEKMTVEELTEKKEIKKRQLTALSGDFYSALYYFSLAQSRGSELVKWIAEAIQSFNSDKCRLYYPQQTFSWAETTTAIGSIESGMVARIASGLGCAPLKPFLNDFFLVKKLVKECQNNGSFFSGCLMKNLSLGPDALKERMHQEIRNVKNRFDARAKEAEDRFSQILTYLKYKMQNFCRCEVEEG